jgi:hypothetical protein
MPGPLCTEGKTVFARRVVRSVKESHMSENSTNGQYNVEEPGVGIMGESPSLPRSACNDRPYSMGEVVERERLGQDMHPGFEDAVA